MTETPQVPWHLLEGDARTRVSEITASTVQTVVTSPPYYWQRDYGVLGQIGHEDRIEEYVQALVQTFAAMRPALTPTGTVFLNLGDTYYSAKGRPHGADAKHSGRQMMRQHLRAVDGPGLGVPRKSLIGIPWRVALALQADGWVLRSAVIWHHPARLPEPSAKDRPWRSFEYVFILAKSPLYYFDRSALDGEEDVWKIRAQPDNPYGHAAPFPEELARRCIRCGSRPDDLVLDPFAGSGTTLLSALTERRRALGVELSPVFCEQIRARLKERF